MGTNNTARILGGISVIYSDSRTCLKPYWFLKKVNTDIHCCPSNAFSEALHINWTHLSSPSCWPSHPYCNSSLCGEVHALYSCFLFSGHPLVRLNNIPVPPHTSDCYWLLSPGNVVYSSMVLCTILLPHSLLHIGLPIRVKQSSSFVGAFHFVLVVFSKYQLNPIGQRSSARTGP